ncbi:AraC family transcriptional regulator [Ottowia thiooxydans]|uniref:AraC family transcriptional regulator n=1 Tax=Ottowia thiooxydans TaxID=219182 RepID=UPI000491D3CC|nr:AraC family transcriptional regulator [Ottowia thiooxydans]
MPRHTIGVMPASSPPPCILECISSHDVEPDVRFDAWRERAHQWVEMLPPSPDVALDAELRMLRGPNGIFGSMRSSAYEMRAAPDRLSHAPDMVILTLVQGGEVLRDGAAGEQQRIGPGSLGLYDPRKMGSYRWDHNSREAFLALPRSEVIAALGCDPNPLPIGLERGTLAPALTSQFNHLTALMRQPQGLDNNEFADLLENTRSLALLMLRNLGRHGMKSDDFDSEWNLDAGRHTAALRFMEQQAHRHDLDVAAVAQGANCSRTRLYAAFASRNETVMGTLRELRLQRAKGLIEQTDRLHVGSLAWRCGFADQSGFSKLFRRRFGMLPSEWHQRARTSSASPSGNRFPVDA